MSDGSISDSAADTVLSYIYLMECGAPREHIMSFDQALYLEDDMLQLGCASGASVPAHLTYFDGWKSMMDRGAVIDSRKVDFHNTDDNLFTLSRVVVGRSSAPQFKGAKTKTHWMGRMSGMVVERDGTAQVHGGAGSFWSRMGGVWVPTHRAMDVEASLTYKKDQEAQRLFERAAFGPALTSHNWCVSIAMGDRPSVKFITTPEGMREVFALRDVPNGAARRSALRNWVRSHARRSVSDPSITHDVREHMRGTQTFSWNGMRCVISPPAVSRSEWLRLREDELLSQGKVA